MLWGDSQQRPTLRELLKGEPVAGDLNDEVLDSRLPDPERGQRFIRVRDHINPSAGRILVFSNDFTFVRELLGWTLATLPDESIVYHRNQIHFSRGKTLEIAVFDPTRRIDRQIYPPATPGAVRAEFRARVAKAYAAVGEDWFRLNNHSMDPDQFRTALSGEVRMDQRAGAMTFNVQFGGEEPLPFSQRVRVSCAPLAPVERIRCSEAAGR